MSTVLQPRGPLPARVYWVRRLLLLAVLVVILGMLWVWLAPGGESQDADGGGGATPPQPTSSATVDGEETAGGDSSQAGGGEDDGGSSGGEDDGTGGGQSGEGGNDGQDDGEAPGDGGRDGAGRGGQGEGDGEADSGRGEPGNGNGGDEGEPEEPVETRPPLPEPTGPCDPADLQITISVADAPAGEANRATLKFRPESTLACTLGVTPDVLEIRITSGTDVVWSSAECPAQVAAQQIVARDKPAGRYQFTWDGDRSSSSCTHGDAALPGGYWVEVALIGGEPTSAYFDIT